MRDYKWLYNIVGIMILISVLYMGLKKIILFLIDITITTIMLFTSFILAYIIACFVRMIFNGISTSIGIPIVSNYAFSYIFLIVVSIIMVTVIGSLSYCGRTD
jgi:hypothetical protein